MTAAKGRPLGFPWNQEAWRILGNFDFKVFVTTAVMKGKFFKYATRVSFSLPCICFTFDLGIQYLLVGTMTNIFNSITANVPS